METIIISLIGVGLVKLALSLVAGTKPQVKPTGVYINPDYTRRIERQARSEFTANLQLAGKR